MNLLSHIVAGIVGFFLAEWLIEGVTIDPSQIIIYAGVVLGILNFFVRPVLRLLTFPFHIITLGLSSFLLNIIIIWFVQAIFLEIRIDVFLPLLYTTIIIWLLEFALQSFAENKT